MTDSPEYRALLDAVLDRPDDDMPRLAMADWHEENGQGERAELIRHGIAHPGFRIGEADSDRPIMCEIRRGFPETAICTLADFLRHAEWIANNWPVKKVKITDADRCLDADNIHLGQEEWSAACIEYLKQVRQGNPEPRFVFTINSTRVASVRVVLQGRPAVTA